MKNNRIKINKSFIEGVVIGIFASDQQTKEKKPVVVEKSGWRTTLDCGSMNEYELWVKINGKISDFTMKVLTETFNKVMPFHCITHVYAEGQGYIVFKPTWEVLDIVKKELDDRRN